MKTQSRLIRIGIVVAAAAFIFQIALQDAMRVHAYGGIYFQGWSSEDLTQTVPLQDLRDAPLESLLNIHIEPPAFDALRAIFVAFSPNVEIHRALREVDLRLMLLWAIFYSLSGALVFIWTAQLTRVWVGLATTTIFLLHPGTILYTTFLDATILTTFLVLCLCYLLWRARLGSAWETGALVAVVTLLYFTKSFFQAPLILLVGFSLHLLGVSRKRLLVFLLVAGGVALIYSMKQFAQFGILHTSSFAGYNLCKSVGIDNNYTVHLNLDARDVTGLPSVLARQAKLTGAINYNNINYLDFANYLNRKYIKYMLRLPAQELLRQYAQNLELYWRPSSRYGNETNVIVERLPYRAAFDAAFSYPIFTILLIVAVLISGWRAIRSKDFAGPAALALPVLAIFALNVLGDKGENMRYKFFLEPVYLVFVVWALHEVLLGFLSPKSASRSGAAAKSRL